MPRHPVPQTGAGGRLAHGVRAALLPRLLSGVLGKEVEGTVNVDPAKLEVFMGKMIGHMTGSTLCYSIWLGDELGLYRELAGTGPRHADSVAAQTGCNTRLVREWLDAQAAGGLVAYDPAADTYELSPEAALALADDRSPVFVARAMNAVGSMYLDVQKVAAAFRGSGGWPGASTTRACSAGPSGSSGPATGPT